MALTYAGIDLSPLTPAMSQILEQFWIKEAPKLWSTPGWFCNNIDRLPIPDHPKSRPPQFNTLIWPNGASRWAEMVVFVAGGNAQLIENAVGLNSPTSQPLVISDTTNNVTLSPQMFLVGFQPLYIQGAGQYWMMYLVDERYYWWIRDYTYTFNAGTDSWSTLLTALVTATGTSAIPTIPVIPTAYQKPSGRWVQMGKPIPLILDAAATTVGLRLIRGLDGSLTFVNAATALTNDENQYTNNQSNLALGGRTTVQEIIGTIPLSVNVSFWGDTDKIETVDLTTLALPAYGSITGVDVATAYVRGDLSADSGGLAAYATQAATDYYGWLLSLNDSVFRSVQNITPTGLEDRLEWEYMPGRQNFKLAEPLPQFIQPFDNENLDRLPWERITTRVVRRDWGDNNQYGDRPPPGYPYVSEVWPFYISPVPGNYPSIIQTWDASGNPANGPYMGGFNASSGLPNVADFCSEIMSPYGPYTPVGAAGSPETVSSPYGIAVPDWKRPGKWIWFGFGNHLFGQAGLPSNYILNLPLSTPVVTSTILSLTGGNLYSVNINLLLNFNINGVSASGVDFTTLFIQLCRVQAGPVYVAVPGAFAAIPFMIPPGATYTVSAVIPATIDLTAANAGTTSTYVLQITELNPNYGLLTPIIAIQYQNSLYADIGTNSNFVRVTC